MHRLLASLGMVLVFIGATSSQEPIPAANEPELKPPQDRLLKDDDARKATELQLQISNSNKVDNSAGAIRAAEDPLMLRKGFRAKTIGAHLTRTLRPIR